MATPHIDDNLLEQYALGTLGPEFLAEIEEHLLVCPDCQTRLTAADEFLWLFRAAATQPDARPRSLWRRLFILRPLTWAGAAAAIATVVVLISVDFRKSPVTPATVFMQTFRGPEGATAIASAKPARLVFDVPAAAPAGDYAIQIVDLLGNPVMSAPAEINNEHLSVLTSKLKPGSYWVRIYRKPSGELIAEYGLRAE